MPRGRPKGSKNNGLEQAIVGHNSHSELRLLVGRIERLEEDKQAIADDIKEIYAEAKAKGFDARTLRQVVRLRKQDAADRAERQALLDLYMSALGMLGDTPLGEAAIQREFGVQANAETDEALPAL